MKIYIAPLEGITKNIFRAAHRKYFWGADKYFAPFITPSEKGVLSTKSKRNLCPENNKNIYVVPQILTNNPKGFITMCNKLNEWGYSEFNLNLGCPSGTVVSKGRGAGFLAYTDELDRFLDNIYISDYTISIKTRIGRDNPEEFYKLMEIFNKYPIHELIIHPRTRAMMYKGKADWDIFEYAEKNSKNKLCYNGDIFSKKDLESFMSRFNTKVIMLGRGVVRNPALPIILKGSSFCDINRLKDFYYTIYEEYEKILSGTTPLLHKMKEPILYMADIFEDNEKVVKRIKKSKKIDDFNSAVSELFTLKLK